MFDRIRTVLGLLMLAGALAAWTWAKSSTDFARDGTRFACAGPKSSHHRMVRIDPKADDLVVASLRTDLDSTTGGDRCSNESESPSPAR